MTPRKKEIQKGMKKLIYTIVFLLPQFAVSAQANVDSLVNVLETRKLTTDEQLKLYEDICQYYFASYDADRTMEYAGKGLALSKKTKNELKSSVFNEYIGYAYYDKRSYDTARIHHEKALEFAVKAKDIEQQVSVNIAIGTAYGAQEMWDLAIEQWLKALPFSENFENKEKYMSILGNLGSAHRMLDNSDKAIYYFEQMKVTAEKTNSLLHKRKAYYELGTIYKDQMEYDKSLEYLQSALKISRDTGSKQYETICLQVLAQLYSRNEKDYDKAIQYAKESPAEISSPKQNKFAGQKISFERAWEFIVEDTLYLEKELRNAIKDLEQTNRIKIQRIDSKRDGIKGKDIIIFNGGE